jgi:hypothetical protein
MFTCTHYPFRSTILAALPVFSCLLSLEVFSQEDSAKLELYSTYHCVGLEVSFKDEKNANATGEFQYRVKGEEAWTDGVDFTIDRARGKMWGSAFPFKSGDEVEVKVVLTDPDLNGPVKLEGKTKLRKPMEPGKDGNIYHLSSKGKDANEGTKSAPWATFKHAVSRLKAGDVLRVEPGVYRQGIHIENLQGTPEKPIVIEGAATGFDARSVASRLSILPDSKPNTAVLTSIREIEGKAIKWKSHGNDVYSAPVSDFYRAANEASYLAMDGMRMFNYRTLDLFEQNPCETVMPVKDRGYSVEQKVFDQLNGKGEEARPAYTYDRDSGRLHFRLSKGDDPSKHRFSYATAEDGVSILGCSNLLIRNLEIAGFGRSGFFINDGSNGCSIVNNLIHHVPIGIFCEDRKTDALTIWNNHLYDRGLHQFSWRTLMAKKSAGGHHGIILRAGRGHSVVENRIHNFFDLLCMNVESDLDDLTFSRDSDIIGNYGYNAGDDYIEVDGGGVNMRILGNRNFNTLECWSLAPIERGPVYVVGNYGLARNYSVKFNNNKPTRGACFLYHNTGYTVGPGTKAMQMPLGKEPPPFAGKVLKNNLFISGKTFAFGGRLGAKLDYNGYWVLPAGPGEEAVFNWEGGMYKTLEEFYKGAGNEERGLIADPKCARLLPELSSLELLKLRAEDRELEFDLRLTGESPFIDRGVIIRGIKHDYKGQGPDIGAFEAK